MSIERFTDRMELKVDGTPIKVRARKDGEFVFMIGGGYKTAVITSDEAHRLASFLRVNGAPVRHVTPGAYRLRIANLRVTAPPSRRPNERRAQPPTSLLLPGDGRQITDPELSLLPGPRHLRGPLCQPMHMRPRPRRAAPA
jgi:hypothetical protein